MAFDAKYVRTLAPAGGVINFISITGNSHRYFWIASSAIKLMLDRGIKVFEKLKKADKDGNTEIELTLENYNTNNSGEEFDETAGYIVVKNLEEERANELKKLQEEFLEEMGLKIAEELEEKVKKLNNSNTQEPSTGGSDQGTITGSGASIGGSDQGTVTGSGASIGGSNQGTVVGSGDSLIDTDPDNP